MPVRNIIAPIHVAAVGLGNLRFFRSPLDGPRVPWFAVSDFFTCLAMDRALRRTFHYRVKHEWKSDIRTIWTNTGETLIGPHFMAQGLIGALLELRRIPAGIDRAYADAGVGAMNALTAGMDPTSALEFTLTAFRNEDSDQ